MNIRWQWVFIPLILAGGTILRASKILQMCSIRMDPVWMTRMDPCSPLLTICWGQTCGFRKIPRFTLWAMQNGRVAKYVAIAMSGCHVAFSSFRKPTSLSQPMSNDIQWKNNKTHMGGSKHFITLWLFNITMENGPFIDGLPGFTD